MIDVTDLRVPQRVLSVIDKLNGGQRLCKSFRYKESGDTEITFTLEPSGKRVGPKSAQAAIETGRLRPLGDGLFGNETSQTWGA
jgi:hypothetical protein